MKNLELPNFIKHNKLHDDFLRILLFRYLSEQYEKEISNIINLKKDFADLSESKAKSFEEKIKNDIGYYVSPNYLFRNIAKQETIDEETLISALNSFDVYLNNSNLENNLLSQNGFNEDLFKINSRNNMSLIKQIFNYVADIDSNKEDLKDYYQPVLEDLFSFESNGLNDSILNLIKQIIINNNYKFNSIYDPFGRDGSLILSGGDKTKQYYSEILEPEFLKRAQMNALLHGVPKDNIEFYQGDTLTNPIISEKSDLVLSFPDYSGHWEGSANEDLIMDNRFTPAGVLAPRTKSDFAYLMDGLSHLADNGTALFFMFPGTLYRGGSERIIRKYLIDNNLIDTIIQLPTGLVSRTNIPLCLLILKKNKEDDSILMINASDLGKRERWKTTLEEENIGRILSTIEKRDNIEDLSRIIPRDSISKDKYNLLPIKYFIKKAPDLLEDFKPLKDFSSNIMLGTYRRDSKSNKEKKPVYIINKQTLMDEIINNIDQLSTGESESTKTVLPGDTLISRNFTSFEASIFELKNLDKPVLADSNIYIIRLEKDSINPYFLLAYLNSKIGKELIENSNASFSSIKVISQKSLSSLAIPVVSKKEQNKTGKNYKKLIDKKMDLKEKLKDLNKEIENFNVIQKGINDE